jgi:hypothetical protein
MLTSSSAGTFTPGYSVAMVMDLAGLFFSFSCAEQRPERKAHAKTTSDMVKIR